MVELHHDMTQCEYQAIVDGRVVARLDYDAAGVIRVFTHTETDPMFQGRGIAGRLTRFALDDVRTAGLAVVSQCAYLDSFLEHHPEYSDVLMAV